MQIDGISSIPPIGSISSTQQAEGPLSRASARTAAARSKVSTQASSSRSPAVPTSAATSSRNASTSRGSSRGGGSGGGSAATGAAPSLIAAVYTFTVDGKTYSGSVEESGGQYVATVPGLPGAVATGASADAAETILGSIIDAIA